MVAYSFKEQFAEKVRDGSKCQTVRGHRTRHARPGEAIQIYTGMRTKQCEKLIADPTCEFTCKIYIDDSEIKLAEFSLDPNAKEKFAIADGFANYAEFLAFFKEVHGLPFEGVLIKWDCQTDMRRDRASGNTSTLEVISNV